MRRREFIAALGGAVAVPLTANAQQRERVRRIALLLPANPTDPEFQARVGAFLQGLQQSGWAIGRNAQLEYRWTEGNPDNTRRYVAELIALAPDAIVADGAGTVGLLSQATRTVPIVFPVAGDPVGAGLVETQARPGGNVTGFMNFEYSIGAKWLELLKEIAPPVAHVAVLRDPAVPTGTGQFGVIQSAAGALRVAVVPVNMRDDDDIERGVTNFAQRPNGGLIVTANPSAIRLRNRIIDLAERHKLPGVLRAALCQRRRPSLLWPRHRRPVPPCGGLRRSHPQRREAGRPAGAGADQVQSGDQPEGREDNRPCRTANIARPRDEVIE